MATHRVSCSNAPFGDHPESPGGQLRSGSGSWNNPHQVQRPHHAHIQHPPELLSKLSRTGFSLGHPESFSEVVSGPSSPAPSQCGLLGRCLQCHDSTSSAHASKMQATSGRRVGWRSWAEPPDMSKGRSRRNPALWPRDHTAPGYPPSVFGGVGSTHKPAVVTTGSLTPWRSTLVAAHLPWPPAQWPSNSMA